MPGEAEKLVSSSQARRGTDKGLKSGLQGGPFAVQPRWEAAVTRAPETGRRAKRGRLKGVDGGRRVLATEICPVGDSAPAVEAFLGKDETRRRGRWLL